VKALLFVLGSCITFAATTFAEGGDFRLQSTVWHEGGSVPQENLLNGCGGSNVSPEFHWSGAPGGTKSFALTIFDPDAPTGAGWWHWVIFNIPGTVTGVAGGAGSRGSKELPPGSAQCRNDYGQWGYGGPCPPVGTTHRYVVRVYALNVEKLSTGSETPAAKMAKRIEEQSLGVARLTVKFGR
jgi:Raf kinase inhibitor-like YbhB/YbcL family protein